MEGKDFCFGCFLVKYIRNDVEIGTRHFFFCLGFIKHILLVLA